MMRILLLYILRTVQNVFRNILTFTTFWTCDVTAKCIFHILLTSVLFDVLSLSLEFYNYDFKITNKLLTNYKNVDYI